jgi:predicted nucleic acid-binding protein
MIILDTNVVSEMMKLEAHPSLERWMDKQHPDDLYVSTITVAELLTGVMEMQEGRRRDETNARVRRILAQFEPFFPPFGREAAEVYAGLAAGNPDLDAFDGQIAAIAIAHGASVATRNSRHFRPLGVDLVDPWAA